MVWFLTRLKTTFKVATEVLGLKGLNRSFGEEEERDGVGVGGGQQGVGGWRERKVKRIGRFLQHCCC